MSKLFMKKIVFVLVFIFFFHINSGLVFALNDDNSIETDHYIPKMRIIKFDENTKSIIENSEKEIVKEYLFSQNRKDLIKSLYSEGADVTFDTNKVYVCDKNDSYKNLFTINSKVLANSLSKNGFKFIYPKFEDRNQYMCVEKLVEIVVTVIVTKIIDGIWTKVQEQMTEYHTVVECTDFNDNDYTDPNDNNDDIHGNTDGPSYNIPLPNNSDDNSGFSGSGSVHRKYKIIY